jgi:spore coat protein CotF
MSLNKNYTLKMKLMRITDISSADWTSPILSMDNMGQHNKISSTAFILTGAARGSERSATAFFSVYLPANRSFLAPA